MSKKRGRARSLAADGRPILGLDSRDLLEITLEGQPLPANPKTSALTVYSVLRAIHNASHAVSLFSLTTARSNGSTLLSENSTSGETSDVPEDLDLLAVRITDLPKGTRVTVKGADGTVLKVAPEGVRPSA